MIKNKRISVSSSRSSIMKQKNENIDKQTPENIKSNENVEFPGFGKPLLSIDMRQRHKTPMTP